MIEKLRVNTDDAKEVKKLFALGELSNVERHPLQHVVTVAVLSAPFPVTDDLVPVSMQDLECRNHLLPSSRQRRAPLVKERVRKLKLVGERATWQQMRLIEIPIVVQTARLLCV